MASAAAPGILRELGCVEILSSDRLSKIAIAVRMFVGAKSFAYMGTPK
jgi:hypothetical protein